MDEAKAAWWPRLDATGNLGRTHLSDTEFSTMQRSGATEQSFDVSSMGLQATWVLFDGFFRTFKLKQMEFGEESSLAGDEEAGILDLIDDALNARPDL